MGATGAVASEPLRVAVVEDQPLYREMIVGLLVARPEVQVVATAPSLAEARELIRPATADVVLLDIHLPDGDGVAFGVQLRRSDPQVGILLLSSEDVMEVLLDVPLDIRTGWGYLLKSSPLASADGLVAALRAAARRRTVLDPELVRSARPRRGANLSRLSHRQLDVLRLVAEGNSNEGVARSLGISPRSVENHLNLIYSVLGTEEGRNPRVSAVLSFIEETVRG